VNIRHRKKTVKIIVAVFNPMVLSVGVEHRCYRYIEETVMDIFSEMTVKMAKWGQQITKNNKN